MARAGKARDKTWRVELNDCPPVNAVVRVRYIPVGACSWSWVETPQTIEGGRVPDPPSTIQEG